MKKQQKVNQLLTFLVAFLLITLPVSVSAQLGNASSSNDSPAAKSEPQPSQQGYGYLPPESSSDSDASYSPQCWPWETTCNGKCTTPVCWPWEKWYCGSSGPGCCPGSRVCNNQCWTDCADDQYRDYNWVCSNGKGACELASCKTSSYPNKCGNDCWGNCGNTWDKSFKFSCQNGQGTCVFDSCLSSSYPNKCGNDCWSSCGSGQTWNCGSDGKAYCTTPCTDSDGDGYGSGCSKGSDCNDNDGSVYKKNVCGACAKELPDYGKSCTVCNGGCCATSAYNCNSAGTGLECPVTPKSPTSEVCGDGIDNNCNGQVDEGCCPSDNPYFCTRTDNLCWLNKERCDTALKCGGQWWACNEPSKYNVKCVNGQAGCCASTNPYFCPSNGFCFSADGFCDGRPVYNCNGKYQVCNKKTDSGACFGDVLRCCPSGESWWESDKQCHKSSEPQKCAVPDGSSAACKCSTNSECSKADSSKPYCSKSYPSPISDGYGRCMSSVPEYCGNGNCGQGENYNSCQTDCGSLAPKGSVEVGVYYASANDKPVSGAYVYLDGVKKGTTGSDGRAIFEAAYGGREVKVECPNNDFCDSKTIQVTGSVYRSFSCGCNPAGDYDGDGYLDADESLLGTDPKDANSNFGVVAGVDFMDMTGGCLTKIAKVVVDWLGGKSKDDIIQAHNSVVSALNVPQVAAVNVEERPYVITAALSSASIDGEIVTQTNVTFEEAVKNADYIDGIITSGELLIVATDVETGTTAIIVASGRCLGVLTGLLYGAGKAVVDDVKGLLIDIPTLIGQILGAIGNAIWFVTVNTLTGNLKKIENSITGGIGGLVGDVIGIYKNSNNIFSSAVKSMVRGILERGNGVNIFRDGRAYNKDAYLDFQIGFLNGYIGGWILGQIATFFVGLGEIKAAVTAIKSGKLAKLFGKALELPESLAKLAKTFGDEAAEGIAKLKYADEIVKWTEAEQKGLARIMKHNPDWAKGLSKAEAQVAGKSVDDLAAAGKIADDAIRDLTKTKLGQQTLKASDATADLLAKQSKLVQKWGVKKADDVISKGWFGIGDSGRINDLNKFLDAYPENLVPELKSTNVAGIIADSTLDEITSALKELKSVKNFEKVAARLGKEDTWIGASNELKQAQKLKRSGKVVVEFQRSVPGSSVDIVYTETGSSVEIFMETKNTVSESADAISDLKNQLDKYYDVTKSWDNVRLSTSNPISKKAKDLLIKEFGSDGNNIVNKLLGG